MVSSLGRGISAFLQEQYDEQNTKNITYISVANIEANQFQPRKYFNDDSLLSLASSIKEKGVIQPIIVRKNQDNSYELIAGERRLRASKIAGLSEIPAIISDVSNKESFELAILENIQRENLNPIDEAEAYKKLMDDFNHTQDGVAKVTGKSRSHIANMLRLLSLDESVQTALINNQISVGHAKSIMTAANQKQILNEIITNSLSVRETEKLIHAIKNNNDNVSIIEEYHEEANQPTHEPQIKTSTESNIASIAKQIKKSSNKTLKNDISESLQPEPSHDIDLDSISSKVSDILKTKVSIKMSNERGAMLIYFENVNELDRLLKEITRSDI